jgi:hypothetical protein
VAELPVIEIEDRRTPAADWRFRAHLRFADEAITVDLLAGGDLRPTDPASIEKVLRAQWLLDNQRPVVDQVRENGPQRTVYFYD